ncbi:Hypothetical predicted protein [Octopus vulgaris]|uniref:Uncharacterized protein n=1 Tax=Octopus vulgaris TaxID=6645 RepID=A0AA36EXI8_OCTVU|nr:Hypothetical predicted protein [Octopus vulgaris]
MFNKIQLDLPSINMCYRLDDGLFNFTRIRAKTRTSAISVHEMQYADDNATPSRTADGLQRTADLYNTAYERFGMQVNTLNTKTLIQPAPGQNSPLTNISINGRSLEEVEHFTYLGSILSKIPTCERDVENRIGAAHSAFGRLHQRLFFNHALTTHTKIMVFRVIVLSAPLYACETWTLYRRDFKHLECFQQSKLRQILNIQWEDHVTNSEVIHCASLPSVEAIILRHRLRGRCGSRPA